MQKEFQLVVDIEKKILTPSFEVNTLDLKTIKLKITITKGMTLVDLADITVRMSIRKPDGNVLFQDCQVVNAKGGQVEIILENQAYVLPGSYSAEIMCFKGADKVAVTGSFSYRSIRGIMDDKAIESKSEFTAITGMIGNVESIVTDLKKNGTGIDAQARQEVQQVSNLLAETTLDVVNLGKSYEGGTSDKDNFSQLTSLITKAKTSKKGLYIPNGRYYCSQDLLIDGIRNIQIDGDIVLAEGKTLEITYSSANPASCNWTINTVAGKLRITGIKNANVKINRATELELFANGSIPAKSSIAYCQFHLGLVESFKISSEGTAIGWITENIFFGGRMKNIVIDGNYPHNNNVFYKPMLEGCVINVNKGHSNYFYDVRFEGQNILNFANGTYNNTFYQNWFTSKDTLYTNLPDIEGVLLNDLGSNQVIRNVEMDKIPLFDMNAFNKPSDINAVEGRLTLPAWKQLLNTGLIELPEKGVIGIDFLCDIPGFRTIFTFYDSSKNQITGSDPLILGSPQCKWSASTNQYAITSNTVSSSRNTIECSKARYMQIKLSVGGAAMNIKFLTSTLIKDRAKQVNWIRDAIEYYKNNPAV